jgi:hypothetical protein
MAKAFDASETSTALRLYLILACCAARGEPATVDDLAQRAKQGERARLTGPLALVSNWCQANGLPALTSIVVETLTESPPPNFKAVPRAGIPREQEKVWAFDWYAIFPPAVSELTSKPVDSDGEQRID